MALGISVFASEELQAVVLSVKKLPADVRKQIRQQTSRVAKTIWTEEVTRSGAGAGALANQTLVRTATVQVRDNRITLIAGGKGSLIRSAPTLAKAAEFGANTEYFGPATSTKGKRYKRHTQRQLPKFAPRGRVVYPAASRAIPRVASLWVQTFVRSIHEAFERSN